ncbi:MAG: BamA/TamA family outer membrane protein [Bacteroidetes bacterium]|nr:BamA/TamA family outer membrane protein [Bacteroidota bacterium]
MQKLVFIFQRLNLFLGVLSFLNFKKLVTPFLSGFSGIFFLLVLQTNLHASVDYVFIENIEVTGQKRTKPNIILRELDITVGDTISLSNLTERIEWNQQLLMNTGLFTKAKINFKNWEGGTNRVRLLIEVSENWFVYPVPIFELADRNFNVWWETYNHSLKRVNFGVRFYHINLTGRKDLMKLVAQYGFTQKYEIEYTLPFINKKQSLGLFTNFLYTRNKELGYTTLENKLQFFRDDEDVLLKRFRGGLGIIHRPDLFFSQSLVLNYHQNELHESVPLELNDDFFLDGLKQRYFSLIYETSLDRRNIRAYPTKGYFLSFLAQKDGFGFFDNLNAFYLTGYAEKYFLLNEKWNLRQTAKGRIALVREKQPYNNSVALGYELDYIRGYEFYVIDGLDYAYSKTSLRFRLASWKYDFGKYMPIKAFKVMPIKLYLAVNNDFGFVNNPFYGENNSLSNELLWGYGVGLDLVIYNDKVFQFEYSANRLGEHGFFLHWEFNF